MKFKKLIVSAGVAVCLGVFTVPSYNLQTGEIGSFVKEADAKSYGSKSSSRSSYSSSSKSKSSYSSKSKTSSSSSSGYKKKSSSSDYYKKKTFSSSTSKTNNSVVKTTNSPYVKPSTTKTSSGGYSKSTKDTTVVPTKSTSTSKRPDSALAKSVGATQSKQVYNTFRPSDSKYKKGVSPTTLKASTGLSSNSVKVPSYNKVSSTRYYNNRDNYYRNRDWNTPSYAYGSYNSFGAWDALWMWMILDSVNDNNYARWAYNHQNDPGFQEWKKEAEVLSKDNAELKAKLAAMDAKVSGMSGPIDPNYVPEGVDPTVMLSPALAVNTEVLNMGTGGVNGNYFQFCNIFKENALKNNVEVNCNNTDGSVENMNKYSNNEFNVVLTQSNVMDEFLKNNPDFDTNGMQAPLYPEVVYMLVNKESTINSIKDVNQIERTYFVGSGAMKTVQDFANEDSNYNPLVKNGVVVEPNEKSLSLVANNPNAALFYVCGLNCDFISLADSNYGDKLKLAAVDDWNFNDATDRNGNDIYTFVSIPEKYENLQDSGWFSSGDVETLAVNAVFLISKDWMDLNKDKVVGFESAFWPSVEAIQNKVGVPQ